ncbi:tyrosine-type recombinase/integrase [Flavobacterium sp. GT3P67]|uniref:tyrosine-type recombinase/integrase n=1 Tax=Flavobacterium sp. GT3P67 TaxID=2541722 RepID=UPI001052025D|nr:tyrosine-type recombinase/integrase [Flavobacterium sp. GT3P67]TDE53743.1 site-specific integrase [Flavobacterium sp. GT3P67]
MAKDLLFDCSYSEIWVHPENWKTLTSKKSLELDWRVECKFYDPIFKEKYPKGFPFRKKLNRFKSLEQRKAVIQAWLKDIPVLFEKEGYNPITKKYMIPKLKPVQGTLYPELNFIEALEINYPKLMVSEGVKKECRRIIAKIKKSAAEQRIEVPICGIHSGHIRDLLDPLDLTNNEYNKYLTHLSIVISDLVEKRMVFHNPIKDIRKKKTIKKIRETLEVDELNKIFKILKANYYTFYRYGMIFFHSGARSAELFRVQKKHVNLAKQEYKITILKGSVSKEVIKVILPNALPFWTEIINECTSEDDFLFTRGLKPSLVPTQSSQITKRWKRLVKDKFDVTADFYSLKHLFLDELDKASDAAMNLSKGMADHTTKVTETVYLVGRETRKNEALKKINFQFLNL